MSWFRLRLTFKLQLLAPHATAATRLNDACRRIGDNSRFLMHDSYGELHLPAREHRLWSPHLFFDIAPLDEEQKADSCTLRGRFAPRVEVWTPVWIIYLAAAFTAFFGLVVGWSQYQVNEPMWGLWVSAGSLLIIAAVNITAQVGQHLSADQMHHLREQLDTLLNQCEIPHRAEE